ncbi:LolA family protein [Atopomonas sediminilitoris]|uniref:LolA family protein n=1 Tax=Atopomonas sediminilitoris TaxID=2919919 RepID=UPI001F4EB653|nr:outer membrane lipoprotein carrier protein LolA [Atopomonas sediminilitoris]MCJ8170374.1 outer membrane lipoprotein carrier protein LolA [Atopomonas sediminilitoris]
MKRRALIVALSLAVLASLGARANEANSSFDLPALSQQLQQSERLHGQFIQRRFLPGLAQPLQSQGRFVMDRELGLLWLIEQPWQLDLRLNQSGLAQQQDGQWLAVADNAASAQFTRLFLSLLQGDHQQLTPLFDSQLHGNREQWQLTLQPRSLLLKQVFQHIVVSGGNEIQQVTLLESQGDRSELLFSQQQPNQPLSDSERRALVP